MKKSLLVLSALLLAGVNSHSAENTAQVYIQDVLFPSVGYDDNDNVEVVIDGELANTCYEIGQSQVKKSDNTFWLSQYAHLREVDGCFEGQTLPSVLNWPISYSNTINLGKLEAGDYKISFIGVSGETETRTLKVDKATSSSVDEKLYAPVTSVFVPDLVVASEDIQVAISGVIRKSCLRLKDDIQIERLGQTIVVLPELKIVNGADCKDVKRPIHEIVSLGHLAPGRYLLHVRSTVGRAVNRTFTVVGRNGNSPNSNTIR